MERVLSSNYPVLRLEEGSSLNTIVKRRKIQHCTLILEARRDRMYRKESTKVLNDAPSSGLSKGGTQPSLH